VTAPVGPLRGIVQAALPRLRRYVLTYPKQGAELLMQAGEDPLLVSWRHGLGRVAAFTSDLSGRWGREWMSWQGLPQLAGQLARDTMRRVLPTHMRAALHAEGDAVRLVADFVSGDGRFVNDLKLRGNVTASDRSTQQAALTLSAPGRYEGRFTPSGRGIHLVTLFAEGEEGQPPSSVMTVPYVAPYPKEYRELTPNLTLLRRLAEETGGEMLDPDDLAAGLKRLYTPSPGEVFPDRETWWPLALAALILFLIDLTARSWRRLSGGERVRERAQ
jgi:hypothetical protein